MMETKKTERIRIHILITPIYESNWSGTQRNVAPTDNETKLVTPQVEIFT